MLSTTPPVQRKLPCLLDHNKARKTLPSLFDKFDRAKTSQKDAVMSTDSETAIDEANEVCKICLTDMQDNTITALDKLNNSSSDSPEMSVHTFHLCNHAFHKDCLSQSFHFDIENSKFPLICPEVDCKQEATISDLKQILSDKDMELFYDRTFKKATET